MSVKRSALAVTAIWVVGALATPVPAADLTLAGGPASDQRRAQRERPQASKIQAKTRKRMEKRQQKISHYSLLNNPAFRHGTGISGKNRLGPHDRQMGLGSGIDYTVPRNAPLLRPNSGSGMPLGTGYKVDVPNSPAASLDCRDKPATPGPGRREMTACFVHRLDKSWKTQTYVSRRSADGNTGWGGGLAVGYDY